MNVPAQRPGPRQVRLPILAVTAQDAAKMLSIGVHTLEGLIRSGQIPTFKIGRRRLISVIELENFVAWASRVGEVVTERARKGAS